MSEDLELKLTRAQRKEIRRIFDLMDENGDGQLNVNEIVKASQVIGMNPTEEEASEMVRDADTNGNGFIDYDEFVEIMKPHYLHIDIEKERLIASFETLDRDGDGCITVNELRFALKVKESPFTEEELNEIIKEADMNGDGRIDYKEFIESSICKKVF